LNQRFLVVYEHGESGYSGHVPDLPGCVSTAETLEEMRKRMRKVVEVHLDLLATQAKETPHPVATKVESPRPVEGTKDKHWVVERMEVNLGASKKSMTA
jgi:predicted RNase H-like HicB family nuclease